MTAYGPLAPIYDNLTSDVDYVQFADFYEKVFNARDKKVATLLDLGCGTGTMTLLMAKRGYELIAADASEDMLCIAQQKAVALTGVIQPIFLCQSMTELDLYGTVDAAVSCLDSINYLPPDDLPQLLHLLHLFIEPNGIFIFDINSPERLRSLDAYISIDEDDNSFCLWRANFNEKENALYYGMDIFTRQGSLWNRSFEEHIEFVHNTDTLKKQLREAGFINIEICDEGPQSEFGRLFIIAENTPHEV